MKLLYKLIMIFVIVLGALPVIAQPPTLPGNSAPIDGGLSLLIAGGVGYGIKKIKDRKTNKE